MSKLGIWVLAGVKFDRVSGALQLPELVGLQQLGWDWLWLSLLGKLPKEKYSPAAGWELGSLQESVGRCVQGGVAGEMEVGGQGCLWPSVVVLCLLWSGPGALPMVLCLQLFLNLPTRSLFPESAAIITFLWEAWAASSLL